MPLDCFRADEQLRRDFRVRHSVSGEPGYLLFLRRELVAGLRLAPADLFAGGHQLAASTLGERLHPDRDAQLVSRAQLLTGRGSSALATQPLAVEKMGASLVGTELAPLEPLDRLAIQPFGAVAIGEQRPASGLDADREV